MYQDAALEAFCDFFNKLDKTYTKKLQEVYTEDVVFEDPLQRVEGIGALEAYFRHLYDNVQNCRFAFHQRQRQGDIAFVTWTMTVRHPRLAGGRQYQVEGCSQLTFDDAGNRVRRHRDYFDAGELLYERVPLLGGVIRQVKRRASH